MDAFLRTEIVRLNRQLAGLVARGQIAEAVQTASQICDVIRRNLGEDHPLLATALVAAGDAHATAGDLAAAETSYEQAVQIGTRAWGEEHPRLVVFLFKLACVKVALGKQGEAVALHRRVVKIRRNVPGADEPRPSAARPAEAFEGLSSRGTAAPAGEASEPEDAGLQTVVPPLPALSARGFRSRLADFCGAVAARLAGRDVVESSVFAPPEAAPGQLFFVQVFAHRPDQRREAEQEAIRADREAAFRARRSLRAQVARGTELRFHLSIPGLEIDQPHEALVWQARPEAVQFAVEVPKDHPARTVVGTVTTSIAGVPLGHVKFKLTVGAGVPPTTPSTTEHLGDDAHRYRRAFVCYAAKDRPEVIKRVTMLRIGDVRVFQDVLSIEPGEQWEKRLYEYIDRCDLFLLFWSSSAKASEWVQRELRYALERKQGDEMNPPEILPVILEAPPSPPPDELAHLHFNDWMMYLAQGPPSAPGQSPAAPQ